MPDYRGALFIGDPHLASRQPGTRKDEYPATILRKLEWCIRYAEDEALLPCIPGDFFSYPRNNSNWLIGELCRLLVGREVIGIYGNHDCQENALSDDDSLSILVKANLLTLVDETHVWRGKMNGQDTIIGGTPWGGHPPNFTDVFWDGVGKDTLVVWMMHHDLILPGYAAGRMEALELPGIHVVVNGHIHHRLEPLRKGKTLWLTPGNIARVKRSVQTKEHVPAALRMDVRGMAPSFSYVEVPHEAFDSVFHEDVRLAHAEDEESGFVKGLAELQARRTETGEGLEAFLEKNVGQFDAPVADEIMRLAEEVLQRA